MQTRSPKLDRPRIRVDFNEMVSADLVLLARDDERLDSSGAVVHLQEGAEVYLYMEDLDDEARPAQLLAKGTAVLNTAGDWSSHVKWCCQIDAAGIYSASSVDVS